MMKKFPSSLKRWSLTCGQRLHSVQNMLTLLLLRVVLKVLPFKTEEDTPEASEKKHHINQGSESLFLKFIFIFFKDYFKMRERAGGARERAHAEGRA